MTSPNEIPPRAEKLYPLPARSAGSEDEAAFLRGIANETILAAQHPDDPYRDKPFAQEYPTAREEDERIALFEEVTTTSMSPLSVHVDFNDLLSDFGESEAVRLIGMLKDLLR
jgi:hypothetical protein